MTIYNISDLIEVELGNDKILQEDKRYVCYLTIEELKAWDEFLDVKWIQNDEYILYQNSLKSSIDVSEHSYSGYITIVKQALLYDCFDQFAFYIKNNLFVIVPLKDEDASTLMVFNEIINGLQEPCSIEKIIYNYFESIIRNDNCIMDSIENRITALEEIMLTSVPDQSMNRQIFSLKKELLMFRDYYEQILAICEVLQENENETLRKDEIKYFRILNNKIERLLGLVNSLMDLTIQLREVYEATLDISLNKIMKVFTVVTSIFLPLTLIAGWYGMNFKYMPELEWHYGYVYVVTLAIIMVIAWILFFKKKHFM